MCLIVREKDVLRSARGLDMSTPVSLNVVDTSEKLIVITGIISEELDLQQQKIFSLRLDKSNWKKAKKWAVPEPSGYLLGRVLQAHVHGFVAVCQSCVEVVQFIRCAPSMARRDRARDSLADPFAEKKQFCRVSKDLRAAVNCTKFFHDGAFDEADDRDVCLRLRSFPCSISFTSVRK